MDTGLRCLAKCISDCTDIEEAEHYLQGVPELWSHTAMPQPVLRNCIILLTIAIFIAINVQGDDTPVFHRENLSLTPGDKVQHAHRARRAVHKPGFFKTLFSVIGEQYSDTKNTFRNVSDMINDNFLPENAPVTEATTPSDPNISTTMAPYKITRTEFNKIIRRNLRGLVRLFNIELQDALKQSEKTRVEYKKNVSKEISKFL